MHIPAGFLHAKTCRTTAALPATGLGIAFAPAGLVGTLTVFAITLGVSRALVKDEILANKAD